MAPYCPYFLRNVWFLKRILMKNSFIKKPQNIAVLRFLYFNYLGF